MDEKVSIIIPVYNKEKLLEKCLKSVKDQTYTNLQIIIVNDGSTDESELIAKEFCEKDKRAMYVYKNNGGLSSARNYGMEFVRGEFIFFLDADDYLENDAISNLINNSDGKDIVIGRYRYVELESSCGIQREPLFAELAGTIDSRQLFDYLFDRKYGINACNKLYKTSFLFETKVLFQPNIEIYAEDLLFNSKVITFLPNIKIVNIVTYNYVQNDESITHSYKENLSERYACLVNDYYKYENKREDLVIYLVCNAINCIAAQEKSIMSIKKELEKFNDSICIDKEIYKRTHICKLPFMYRLDYWLSIKLIFNNISLLAIYQYFKRRIRG